MPCLLINQGIHFFQFIVPIMTYLEIIGLLLGSTVLSALINALVNLRTAKSAYRREYYKKIIDKRLESLDLAHEICNQLRHMVYIGNGETIMEPFHSHEKYAKLLAMLFESARDTFWQSDQLADAIQDLNLFVISTFDAIQKPDDDALNSLGFKHIDELRKLRNNIESAMIRELESMDDIKKFLTKKPRFEPIEFKMKH